MIQFIKVMTAELISSVMNFVLAIGIIVYFIG
jgi:hypothetical protein